MGKKLIDLSTCRYERSPGPLGGAPLAGAPPAPWVRAQPEKYLRPPMGALRQVLDIVWQLFRVSAGSAVRARFVIKKRIFSIENKYCLHFPRFSFSDSGFFSCSQTKSQGSASRYIVCISSYPEQVEFSSVCMCQHFSFLHFLRRLDKRTFFIRVAWFEVRSEGIEKSPGHSRQTSTNISTRHQNTVRTYENI